MKFNSSRFAVLLCAFWCFAIGFSVYRDHANASNISETLQLGPVTTNKQYGAAILGNILQMSEAYTDVPGIVTYADQIFGGLKHFPPGLTAGGYNGPALAGETIHVGPAGTTPNQGNDDIYLERNFETVGTAYFHSQVQAPNGVNSYAPSSGTFIVQGAVSPNISDSFAINANGDHSWGDGTNPFDATIYRKSAGVLATDGSIALKESGATPTYFTSIMAGDQAADLTLVLPVDAGSAGYVLKTDGAGVTSWADISGIAGTVAIAHGGTGQTTANAGFAALSPMTTDGDLITRSGGVPVLLGIGTTGQVLQVSGGAPVWGAFPLYSISSITANPSPAVSGTTYLCDTSGGGFSVTLPTAAAGAYVNIKDKTGSFQTNNLTIVISGGTKIEGLNANKILQTNWGSWGFVSDGTDWFIGGF